MIIKCKICGGEMNKFYAMLMQFSQGSTPSRSHLIRKYGEELVDEALSLGYIRERRKNAYGELVYEIKDEGKLIRDK